MRHCPKCGAEVNAAAIVEVWPEPAGWQFYGQPGARVIRCRGEHGGGGGSSSAPPTRKSTEIITLQQESGRGNTVSADFTVPDDCPRQTLSYRGELISGSGGFINFRVYDTAGNPADSAVGPVDLDEEQEGRAMWSLGPGAYAVEVTADNAEWSYRVQCR